MPINILVTDSLLDGLQVKGYVFLERAVYTMFHHTHLPLLSSIDSINRENNTSFLNAIPCTMDDIYDYNIDLKLIKAVRMLLSYHTFSVFDV